MSSSSSQRMFQLKLDPLTGNSEWVVIDEDEQTFQFHQPLLATTSYLDMLNDSTRNTAFREAIEKTITKPCHVLDIGYSHCAKFDFNCFVFSYNVIVLCNCAVLELGCFL